jgi:hypothetical protein
MKKITGLLACLLVHAFVGVHAQNISRIEYFFDADPGFGNATPVGFAPATNIADLSFNADMSSLNPGIHRLFLRSCRDDGTWSITNSWLFLKASLLGTVNVNRLEYFFDTDPGFGSGTAVAVTPSGNISDQSFNADISSLSNGLHRLFVRSQGNDGSWSVLNSWLFFKSGQFLPVNITRLEYFFDTDPGFGNGTSVAITPGTNVSDFSLNAGIGALSLGLHTVFLRTQSNDGAWSQTTQWLFYKASFAGAGNLTALEYFFDTDPGFGNGVPLTISSSNNLADLGFDLNVAALSNGTHRLFVRSRDAAGNWSISNVVEFDRSAALPVNWLRFTAEQRNAQVFLEWRTDNEVDNDHYEVEHCTDGVNYRPIAIMSAQSGAGTHVYNYLHEQPDNNGINYYRIKQVDTDGDFTFSPARMVDMSIAVLLTVLPNPADDFIEIKGNEPGCTAKLFDLNGRQLRTKLLNSATGRMELTGLASGNYLLVIEKAGRLVKTLKLVKK